MNIIAAMSVPRIGFMDNFTCNMAALSKAGINLRLCNGVFWGQSLQCCLEECLEVNPQYILTIDYDSIFTYDHLLKMVDTATKYPGVDALIPVQMGRFEFGALGSKRDRHGVRGEELNLCELSEDLVAMSTGHFGLTLIKAEKLAKLPQPWFMGTPGANGSWRHDSGKTDEDVYFWNKWEEAGNSLFLAPRVAIGHLELMIKWPDENMNPVYQPSSNFWRFGLPGNVWK